MKRDNVSKDYLLKKIYFELGIPTSFSKKIVNSIFDIIIEGLQKDGKVKLSGFGTFRCQQMLSICQVGLRLT